MDNFSERLDGACASRTPHQAFQKNCPNQWSLVWLTYSFKVNGSRWAVYASKQTSQYTSVRSPLESRLDLPGESREHMDFSALLDPSLLQSARHIYRTYYEVHPEQVQRPLGVAIDRVTHRGKLIFIKPILLPQECFVPLSHIESDLR